MAKEGSNLGEENRVTTLLEKAFAKASELSKEEQNALAKWLLQEMESEHRWDSAFLESEKRLSELAEEALLEHGEEHTKKLD